jgi:Ca-activated chloride channel homolog
MKKVALIAGISGILAAFLFSGSGLAQQQQKQLPNDMNVNSMQQAIPQQAGPQAVSHGRGRPGRITRLPLSNLKALKVEIAGKTGWKVNIPGRRALATPAVVDGMVYIGGGFGSYEFYAFDAKSGKARWAIKVSDDGPTAAVAAEGVVAFNTESCTLFVVDGKTGKQLWSRWLGDPLMSQPAIASGKVFMAYPGGGGHRLIAMKLKTGKKIWEAKIKGDIISSPVVSESSVYVTTFDGTVYRFNAASGKLIWKENFQATSAPWLFKQQVFVAKRDPNQKASPVEGVARMAGGTGKQNQAGGTWRNKPAPYLSAKVQSKSRYVAAQKADDSSVGFSSGPASAKLPAAQANVGQGTVRGLWEFQGSRPCVSEGVLYLTQGNQVVAMSPENGKEIWKIDLAGDMRKIGGHLGAPPSPAGDKLYLATATGKILLISKADGRIMSTIEVKAPIRFQPALSKGRLYVGTTDGQLIAIDLGDSTADGWSMWGGGPGHNGA